MVQHFRLKQSVKEQDLPQGLPIDQLYEKGVLLMGSRNAQTDTSNGVPNEIVYLFRYFDESGSPKTTELEKSLFETFFELDDAQF